ncbi:MAG: ABC transporter ATP-binding protein [Prevotella sp.]
MNTLTLSDLTIGYDRHTVASHLDATLRSGSLTCLIGRNGTGKSTLLRTLGGFLSPLGGHVAIGGVEVTSMSRGEMSRLVSVVLTHRPDVRQLTVAEVVALGRTPYTGLWGTLSPDDRLIVAESIETVGITSLSERHICTLSDGECQKVMIAKALAQQTPVILLDEPTAFLDYPSKRETMLLMRRIAASGKAVLLSTHDMEMALRLADTLWLMTSSHNLLCGTAAALHEQLAAEHLLAD